MGPWPAGRDTPARIPVSTASTASAPEQETIFGGPSWCYAGLAAEVPQIGDFKRTFVGDKSVVLARDADGALHVLANRCAHRGVQFCQQQFGNATEFMCPYHQWTYDLKGNLV